MAYGDFLKSASTVNGLKYVLPLLEIMKLRLFVDNLDTRRNVSNTHRI